MTKLEPGAAAALACHRAGHGVAPGALRNPAPAAPMPPGPGAAARPTQSLSTTSRLL
jgi:hypothetical protein